MPTSTTLTPETAAMIASGKSGLPYALTLALIQAEQGPAQLVQTGNAFDVVQGWLNLTGDGSIVTRLWNSVGVAVVSDPSRAISSWWAGLSTFSNYTTFRLHLFQGASVRTLIDDLGKAGYAGSDYSGWASNVLNLYKANGGNPDAGPNAAIDTAPSPLPSPTVDPSPLSQPADYNPQALTVTKSTDPVFGGLINAVNGLQATAIAVILSVERFFWIGVGLALMGLGVYVLTQSERG
jgi:hypothetical protein